MRPRSGDPSPATRPRHPPRLVPRPEPSRPGRRPRELTRRSNTCQVVPSPAGDSLGEFLRCCGSNTAGEPENEGAAGFGHVPPRQFRPPAELELLEDSLPPRPHRPSGDVEMSPISQDLLPSPMSRRTSFSLGVRRGSEASSRLRRGTSWVGRLIAQSSKELSEGCTIVGKMSGVRTCTSTMPGVCLAERRAGAPRSLGASTRSPSC